MKSLWMNTKMFESSIFLPQHLKITGTGKRHTKTMAWSSDMEGHAQKRLNVTVNWQTSK